MKRAVITNYVRTPFQPVQVGGLAGTRADDLAAIVFAGLIERSRIDGMSIEDVLLGCTHLQPGIDANIARVSTLLARFPVEVPGMTLNRVVGSSMSAIHIATGQIAAGAGDVFVCGGVESISFTFPDPRVFAPNFRVLEAYVSPGETAEAVASRFRISRDDQEAFVLGSWAKALRAQAAGHFNAELVRVPTAGGIVDQDACLSRHVTPESLADLPPAHVPNGTVTAGTSAPRAEGASAMLVTSETYADKHRLIPLARIRALAVAGCPPDVMGMGLLPAVLKALDRAGLTIGDIDVVELNEVFASDALACVRELGVAMDKVNLDGGAFALGDAEAAAGCWITGRAARILKREGGTFALAAQSIGGGQGVATILEAV